MVADKREFIRLDVGYVDNPKVCEVIDASPVAVVLHIAAICYSRQHRTDGVVPIERLARKVGAEASDIEMLASRGLIERANDGSTTVHDYLKHQESAEQIAARSEAAKRAIRTRWDGVRNTERNTGRSADRSSERNTEERRGEESKTATQSSRATTAVEPGSGNSTARLIDAGLITPGLRREFLVSLKENGARDTGGLIYSLSQDELRGKVEDWLAERDASNVVALRAPVMHFMNREHHDSCRTCQIKAGGTWDEVHG